MSNYFITNITGVPTTGQYGSDGKPVNINNDGGIEVTPQDAGNVPSASTESREGVNNDKSISGNPYNQSASSTDTPSPVGNPNIGNYVESLSERIVDDGGWNSFTAQYSTPPFSTESGCWNIGNSSDASPYVNTLKVDNAIQADNIMTMGIGGSSRPVVPERKAPPCDCPRFASDEEGGYNRPDPQWGRNIKVGTDGYVLKEGEGCQPPRANQVVYPEAGLGGALASLRNMKLYYFSGVHSDLTGIFTIVPFNYYSDPLWINDMGQDKDLFDDGSGPCYPNQEALRTAINGGYYPGANCTYKHLLVGYRGTGISDFGVSGVNWTGWCGADFIEKTDRKPFQPGRRHYSYEFYESRVGGNCSGKPGYLYACDHDGSISELTPMYQWTIQDSCDCHALYENGRWKNSAYLPAPEGYSSEAVWVQNAEPDWDASNSGTGYRESPPTQVYWTGEGCWSGFSDTENHSGTWDETKVFAIVATGGEGPGAGDNIPPYWSDTDCDWIYAIREVVSGDCTGVEITGCPSGPTIEIGLTKLHDATCGPDLITSAGTWPDEIKELVRTPCPGIDWICCLSGTGDDPGTSGYCTAIQNRGSKYPNGDMVCYADGSGNVTGAEGQNWIVDNIPYWSGDADPVCNWIYDLQYYNPYIPGPSGALQTGILESAISTGCI